MHTVTRLSLVGLGLIFFFAVVATLGYGMDALTLGSTSSSDRLVLAALSFAVCLITGRILYKSRDRW